MLRCWDSNFQNWSFCIPKLVDPLDSCSWDGQWWGCCPGPSKRCQSKGSGTPCDCKTPRLCRCCPGLLDPSTCNYFLKVPQKSAVSVSLLPAHALKLQIIAPTVNCHALLWTQFLLADDSQPGAMTASYCYSWVLCGFLQAPELFTTSPALAIPKAIASAGIEQSQVNFYEINEAFAVRIILVPHCKILSY